MMFGGRTGAVPVCLATALALTSCGRKASTDRDAAFWRLERHKIDLESQVKLCRFRLESRLERESSFRAVEERLEGLVRQRREMARRADQLGSEIARLEPALASRRDRALRSRRASWTGQALAELPSLAGRCYEDVTISEVTPIGLEIRHSTGLARITAADLSADQRQRFGIDAAESSRLLTAERTAQRDYEERMGEQLAMIEASARTLRPEPVAPRPLTRPQLLRASRPNPLHASPRRIATVRHRTTRCRTRYYPVWHVAPRRAPVVCRPVVPVCPPTTFMIAR